MKNFKPVPTQLNFLVMARRWQNSLGSTYHNVRVVAFYPNGNMTEIGGLISGVTYGYERQYETTAYELLKEAGFITPHYTLTDFTRNPNNHFIHDDVKRKKDLTAGRFDLKAMSSSIRNMMDYLHDYWMNNPCLGNDIDYMSDAGRESYYKEILEEMSLAELTEAYLDVKQTEKERG
jgi:hypothetical protein